MMEYGFKRLICLALCFCMLTGLMSGAIPAGSAEDFEEQPTVSAEPEETALQPEPEETELPEIQPEPTEPEPDVSAEPEPSGETEVPAEDEQAAETETAEPEETEPVPDTPEEPAAPAYPWEEMSDEAFADFIRAGGHVPYRRDADAIDSLLNRLRQMEDAALQAELVDILTVWLETATDTVADPNTPFEGVSNAGITLDDINGPGMFFKQEVRGTCTLAANAMLVRRAARINGNPYWDSVTESTLRGTAWIEGTGMSWSYTYAGITVNYGSFASCDANILLAFLKQHPEGFVAYNRSRPHAVLITDYDEKTGIFYCADPGFANWRMPLEESILRTGDQNATIRGFDGYWAVSSPKLTLDVTPSSLNERPIVVTPTVGDGSVKLNWTNTSAPGYWVFRSDSPDGPWTTPIYDSVGAANTTWTDTSVSNLKTYYYCVQSYDSSKTGCYRSAVVSCVPDRTAGQLAGGVCGADIRWVLYNDGVMVIAGTGAMTNYSSDGEQPWSAYRASIREVRISDGITSVGRTAFGLCTQLTTVTIPSSMVNISEWAFHGCTGLTTVNMEGGKSIGYAAFRECTSLTEITLPSTMTTVGDWAFSACSSLKKAVLPSGLKVIGVAVFYEDAALTEAAIPSGVTSIGAHAFRGCKQLNTTIPASVTSIGTYAFTQCNALTQLDLSANQNLVLEDGAFYNCNGLTSVTLPTCRIGSMAFGYCYSLKHMFMNQKSAGTVIASNAFANCTKLRLVMIQGSTVDCASDAFSGTSAEILVSSSAYGGNYTATIGGNTWRSVLTAGNCSGDVYWYIDSNLHMMVFGNGIVPDYQPGASPWINQIPSATSLTIDSGITYLGGCAFLDGFQLKTVRFLGNAPGIAFSAFQGVTATVYYHNTNGSWNGVAGKPYNGALTWKEDHNYIWRVTTEPTFTATGMLTGTCAACAASNTVELPKLDQSAYNYSVVNGTGRYVWKVTGYGTFSFDVPLVQITAQPQPQSVRVGQRAAFTVTASGTGLRYVWMWHNPGKTDWTECGDTVPGAYSATLTPDTSTTANNGRIYCCVITDGNGSQVVSDSVQLLIDSGLAIVSQPKSMTVAENRAASFALTASGTGLTYRWQWKASTTDWADCTSLTQGYNTSILSPVGTAARDGYKYRCIVTDAYGQSVTSEEATLSVRLALNIVTHPASVKAAENAAIQFHVVANGSNLRYQWYEKSPAGTWVKSAAAGNTTDTLSLTASRTIMDYQYYCVVTDGDGNTAATTAATLQVLVLAIKVHPQSTSAAANATVTFQVEAFGDVLRYQWQYCAPAGTWSDASSFTGSDTDTLTVPVTAARDGFAFRCIVTDAAGNSLATQEAILTVNALEITTQPKSQTATSSSVTFRVVAQGEGLTYQWQFKAPTGTSWSKTSAEGATTAALVIPATISRNGYQYRCMVTDAAGNKLASDAATLTIAGCAISKQPESVTVQSGSDAVFKVAASGTGLTYQWQFKTPTGNWAAVQGGTADTLTVSATPNRNGYQYRCIVRDLFGSSVTSDAAVLQLTALEITSHPESRAAVAGTNVTFHVAASGDGLLYQWYFKTPAGTSWNKTSAVGFDSDTLTIPATTGRNGYSYRCVITDASGNKATSAAAVLTVTVSSLKIVTQPQSCMAKAGETAIFSVSASGSGLTYQWYFKTPTGTSWNKSPAEGSTTATLSIPATAGRSGYSYRCVVKDATGNSVTSEAAVLTVSKLAILTQPKSQEAREGETVLFTVEASGEGLTYQWYYKTPSSTSWLKSPSQGSTTNTLTIPATLGRDGYRYCCVVRDAAGSAVTSAEAQLNVVSFRIMEQTISVTTILGAPVEFDVIVPGSNLTYQWQYRKPGGNWQNSSASGSKTNTLRLEATAARNGMQYRCIVSDAAGNQLVSEPAVLEIITIGIVTQPMSQMAAQQKTVKFTVEAMGDGLTYQWQYMTPTGEWRNSPATGNKTPVLTLTATESRNGYLYRCIVTNAGGEQVISNAALLTVY